MTGLRKYQLKALEDQIDEQRMRARNDVFSEDDSEELLQEASLIISKVINLEEENRHRGNF